MDAIVAEVLRLDLLGKLALATFLGGVIGWEREASGKAAGLRTNILICVGAALLTELSIHFSTIPDGVPRWDPARISAQVVSGIGFLGAGTILQSKGTVTGLTTAATLWVVAAIGMSAGAGAPQQGYTNEMSRFFGSSELGRSSLVTVTPAYSATC